MSLLSAMFALFDFASEIVEYISGVSWKHGVVFIHAIIDPVLVGSRPLLPEYVVLRVKKHVRKEGQKYKVNNQSTVIDQDVANMLANAPLGYVLAVKDDVDLSGLPDEYEWLGIIPDSGYSDHKTLKKAEARLALFDPERIRSTARELSHTESYRIVEWGRDIEEAFSRYVNDSLERSTRNSFTETSAIHDPLMQLRQLSQGATKSYAGRSLSLSGVLSTYWRRAGDGNAAFMSVGRIISQQFSTIKALEQACVADRDSAEGRMFELDVNWQVIDSFYQILSVYRGALADQAGRIKRQEAEAYQGRDVNDGTLKTMFDKGPKIKDDIEARLHALDRTLHVCRLEYGSFQQLSERQKEIFEGIQYFTSQQVPMFRQLVVAAQQVQQGARDLNTAIVSKETRDLLGKASNTRLLRGLMQDVVGAVNESANALQRQADEEVKAITHAGEVLQIEEVRPTALLEAPKVSALTQ